MWKLLFESVQGLSHLRTDQPCQDSCSARELSLGAETVLVLACSDGAGSAELSHVGSRLACDSIVELITSEIQQRERLPEITSNLIQDWLHRLHDQLDEEAKQRDAPLRQLACTLLAAIVGETSAAFLQIGDGAIVVADEGSYKHVFWPQSGEYANTTNFVTDLAFEDSLLFDFHAARIDEIALLTDGLQMLALSFSEKRAHEPFFRPMFQSLRDVASAEELSAPLRDFLGSPQINDRTDDDKTLILATRVQCNDSSL
jgi:hypothetical protein